MKVLMYCQFIMGVGHFFRSIRIASALSGHEVILLAGGPEFPVDLPDHVQLVRQAGLRADESFSRLVSCDGLNLEEIKKERASQLLELMEEFRPDVVLMEQYPFGRGMFRFELKPCLKEIAKGRFGAVKVVSSVRDILSVRKDPGQWEQRVLDRLGERFDAVLVHGDPNVIRLSRTFENIDQIRPPIHYTGYVAHAKPVLTRKQARQRLGMGGEKLVVAGFGGGRVGREFAGELISAFRRNELKRAKLILFSGPLVDEAYFQFLVSKVGDSSNVRLEPYIPEFSELLVAADLAVTFGGYNTCMDILAAGIPALVRPLDSESEQVIRCNVFSELGVCGVLGDECGSPRGLAMRIEQELERSDRPMTQAGISLDGAANTARLLEQIVKEGRA